MHSKLRCVNCEKASSLTLSSDKKAITCSQCDAIFNIIEGIPIMLDNTDDFYNYNRKLKRFFKLNE